MNTTTLFETKKLFDNFIESGRNRGLSKYTIQWYTGILRPFSEKYFELPATPEIIEGYIGQYVSGDERRHGVYRVLRAFYNFTCNRLEIKNPIVKITAPCVLPKAKRALTIEQLRQVLDYPGHKQMVRVLLHLLTDTGLRIGEVARITGADIGDGDIKVSGKTGERIVPISPSVKSLLLTILPDSKAKEQRLFPHTPLWLGRIVGRAIKSAGPDGFNCHSLRHTFCTLWAGNDTSLKYITGHASWRMIEHYKHQRGAEAAGQHKLYSPIAMLHPESNSAAVQLVNITNPGPVPGAVDSKTIQTIIELAEENGRLKERNRFLSAQMGFERLANYGGKDD